MLWQWLTLMSLFVASSLVGFALQWLVLRLGARLTHRTRTHWDNQLVQSVNGPLWLVLWALIVHGASSMIELPDAGGLKNLLVRSLTIVGAVWFAHRLLKMVTTFVGAR